MDMSEKDINRWHADLRRNGKPEPMGNGLVDFNRWEPAPITDEMLAELTQRFHYAGAPWNCRSMPLSPSDREYMFLLSFSMQGLVSRMRRSDEIVANVLAALRGLANECELAGHGTDKDYDWPKVMKAAREAIAKATDA
jgi:hypothetical protein